MVAHPSYAPKDFDSRASLVSRRGSRRLPSVPAAALSDNAAVILDTVNSYGPSARRASARPLPRLPPPVPAVLLTCKSCKTCITSKEGMFPQTSVRSFASFLAHYGSDSDQGLYRFLRHQGLVNFLDLVVRRRYLLECKFPDRSYICCGLGL